MSDEGQNVCRAEGPDLVAIAEAAWRVREMLHLNLPRIVESKDPALVHNVVDAINDLNACLPACEDGPTWRPETRAANRAWGWR